MGPSTSVWHFNLAHGHSLSSTGTPAHTYQNQSELTLMYFHVTGSYIYHLICKISMEQTFYTLWILFLGQ